MTVFRERRLPEGGEIAGYAWIVERYALKLPASVRAATIAGAHRPHDADGWLILPRQYAPAASLDEQLEFALKWEGIDLAVLDALFGTVADDEIARIIRDTPTGKQSRRLWFLYEWLTERQLDIPDAARLRAVDVVDASRQFSLGDGELSRRHRVRDNLPGTRAFCPMVRRTRKLNTLATSGLAERARAVMGPVPKDIIARAASFLLLSDSRASFWIEGEAPAPDRARRWAQTLATAGSTELTVDGLEALQRAVIGDARFVRLGLRTEEGFIGEHDRLTRTPIPDHISARAADLTTLLEGLVAYDRRAGRGAFDAVVAAAVEAFGFVYIHPFIDGNGRIHRWLMHHVLAAAGFAQEGAVFPVSAAILRVVNEYKRVLETYSQPLLAVVEWRPNENGNVEVLNETASWYRYFDATAHAEFMYDCVKETIEHDLPFEVAYLSAHDRFVEEVTRLVDMPSPTLELLHRFLRQNGGRLSNRGRNKEFAAFTDVEVARIEEIYDDSVADLPSRTALRESEVEAAVEGQSDNA
ncbi:MAG: Fic family protein [Gemmatimonadaceae bacterium]